MPPRPYLLLEANNQQLEASPPTVAVLPWGAVESHNYHLPYGTDVLEATGLAERAAAAATAQGARLIVMPAVPFGNDEQQLDQACFRDSLLLPYTHALKRLQITLHRNRALQDAQSYEVGISQLLRVSLGHQ